VHNFAFEASGKTWCQYDVSQWTSRESAPAAPWKSRQASFSTPLAVTYMTWADWDELRWNGKTLSFAKKIKKLR